MDLTDEVFLSISKELANRWEETLLKKEGSTAHVEVEARFMTFTSRNIGVKDFLTVFDKLRLLALKNNWHVSKEIVSCDCMYNFIRDLTIPESEQEKKTGIKERIEDVEKSIKYRTKIKIGSAIENLDYAFRIGFALEADVNEFEDSKTELVHERDKKRTTITIKKDEIESVIEIAMTKVITTVSATSEVGEKAEETWEIEAEIKKGSFDDKYVRRHFASVIKMIVKLIHGTDKLYDNEERLEVVNKISRHLFKIDKRDTTVHTKLPTKFQNKPKDLLLEDLSSQIGSLFLEPYSVTLKTNGERVFCYYGDDGIYLFRPPFFFNKITNQTQINRIGTIFDGELLPRKDGELYTIQIFDVLILNIGGIVEDIRRYSLTVRLQAARYLSATKMSSNHIIPKEYENQLKNKLQLNPKRFWIFKTPEKFHEAVSECWKSRFGVEDEDEIDVDGLIFTAINRPYLEPNREILEYVFRCSERIPKKNQNPTRTRKWKPFELLTIDFKAVEENKQMMIMSFSINKRNKDDGTRGGLVPFTGSKLNGINPMEDVEFINIVDGVVVEVKDGQIAEFVYVINEDGIGKFKPLRLRPDKNTPNQLCVAEVVWSLISNPIDIGVLLGQTEGITLMRKYHNRFKNDILEKISKDNLVQDDILEFIIKRPRLFDIGSGQGAQVNAWKFGNFKVFAVEPNTTQLKELRSRLFEKLLIKRREYDSDMMEKKLVDISESKGQEINRIVEELNKIHKRRNNFLNSIIKRRNIQIVDEDLTAIEKEDIRSEKKHVEKELKINDIIMLRKLLHRRKFEKLERIESKNVEDDIFEIEKNFEEKYSLKELNELKINEKLDDGGFVKFDAVTQFFSLTFFYGDAKNVDDLITTITTVLRKGGTFHCIALDGNLVLHQLNGRKMMVTGDGAVKIYRIDDPTNVKIHITLKGTLVDQDEFLVDFDDFISKLERRGFVLEEDRYLTGEQILSPAELWFSSMNRYIKLKYIGGVYKEPKLLKRLNYLMKKVKMPMLPPGERQKFPLKTELFKNLWRVGVIGDGACFFHGVVYCLNDVYRTTYDKKKKIRYIQKLRLELSELFDKVAYEKLGKGNLAELGQSISIIGNDNKAYSFLSMKASLANYASWVGNEFREFVGNILDVNIHIVWWVEDDLKVYRASVEKDGVFQFGRNSVILFWQGGNHFEVVGRNQNDELGFLFKDEDPLIKYLREKFIK